MPFLEKPDDVNDSQWQAIRHETGHLLIVAGPGTGKTHTLTYRILHLLSSLKQGQKVLAVTFTNKAANEMRLRLAKRSAAGEPFYTVGTFHSFCQNFLKQHGHDFRVPSFDEIEALMEELEPDLKKGERRRLLEQISLWKAKDFTQSSFPELLAYDVAMRQKGWLDFDDLLLETVKFLTAHREVLTALRQKYPYVFVDEYQDINPIQHKLLKMLIGPAGTGKITAIGDPHQAIYGFRGSSVKFFESFAADFPGATILNLSENYRSGQNIISASSQLIRGQSSLHIPPLTAKIYSQGRLVIHEASTDKAEAEYVVHQIEKMVGGTSMFSKDSGRLDKTDEACHGFGDIAVLFRLNSQRAVLEDAFNRSGIPYHITEEREYENAEETLANAFKHNNDSDKVSLMTLHAAKGLEFGVVFIVGCEEDLLPLNMTGLTTDKAEERRLFYVGVTRAKENLFLVRAARRRLFGKSYETLPSSFLSDIEEELKEYERFEQRVRKKKDDGQLTLFS
jgi:DNA helicase-2/ATP-dependent DNA helicase PcrA